MMSSVVFGISSSAAHGLNVPGMADLDGTGITCRFRRGLIERPEWGESGHLLAVAVGVALPQRVRQDLVEKAVRFFGRGRRRSEQNPIHDGRDDAF